MSTRRDARECIVQLLFQLDMNPAELDETFVSFWAQHETGTKAREFAEDVVRKVVEHRETIDATIEKHAEHWKLRRMGGIERNVMRMAVCEMMLREDIPPVVSINEAVDLAKYFGATESGRFVNGILDRFRKSLSRPGRTRVAAGPGTSVTSDP